MQKHSFCKSVFQVDFIYLKLNTGLLSKAWRPSKRKPKVFHAKSTALHIAREHLVDVNLDTTI